MKIFCSVFVLFMAVVVAVALISEHEVDKLVEKCRYDYFPGIKNYELGESANKCTMACIMTKGGVMDETNKLVPEELDYYILSVLNIHIGWTIDGQKSINVVREEMGEACKLVTDPDECEAAGKILSCMRKQT